MSGTKSDGLLVAVPIALVLALGAWHHRSELSRPFVLGFGAAGVAAAIPLGVWPYVVNLATFHKLALPPQQPGAGDYGDWSNIWQYTAMVVIHPFGDPNFVWNPFRGGMWWWPSNDVWMSHFGAIFSVLIVAVAPCVVVFRKRGARVERSVASLAAAAIYVLVLPLHGLPIGFFSTYARYVVFVLPVVAAWTVSPLSIVLERHLGKARALALVAVALVADVGTTKSFFDFGVHDAYAPIEYVGMMMDHPESRTPFIRQNRAASAFDSFAGPNETVAFDLGFDTWVYPAYGAAFTRHVEFLKPTSGEVAIPDDAGWVIVDRTWNIFFGHPDFVDMSKAYLLGQGKPTDDDLQGVPSAPKGSCASSSCTPTGRRTKRCFTARRSFRPPRHDANSSETLAPQGLSFAPDMSGSGSSRGSAIAGGGSFVWSAAGSASSMSISAVRDGHSLAQRRRMRLRQRCVWREKRNHVMGRLEEHPLARASDELSHPGASPARRRERGSLPDCEREHVPVPIEVERWPKRERVEGYARERLVPLISLRHLHGRNRRIVEAEEETTTTRSQRSRAAAARGVDAVVRIRPELRVCNCRPLGDERQKSVELLERPVRIGELGPHQEERSEREATIASSLTIRGSVRAGPRGAIATAKTENAGGRKRW